MLPLGISLGQHYSPFRDNDFRTDDGHADGTNNTKAHNACLEPFNSTQGMNSNNKVDDMSIDHYDIPINDENEH